MRKIILKLLIIVLAFFPVAFVKAEEAAFNADNPVFSIDISTLKYEQKQLVYAVLTGDEASVKTILDSDPEPKTTYAKIPLTVFAVYANKQGVLKQLIEDYSFDPNEAFMNVTPLDFAILKKRYKIIKYLLSIGVQPSDEALQIISRSKNKKLKALFE